MTSVDQRVPARDGIEAKRVRTSSGPASDSRRDVFRICRQAARWLVLACLAYAIWRFGGVDSETLHHVGWMLLLAAVLTGIGFSRRDQASQRTPIALYLLAVLTIAWPLFQTLPLPESPHQLMAPGSLRVQRAFAGGESDRIARSISVVPSLTYNQLQQLGLAVAVLVLSATLFATRSARKTFLWVLAVNAACLAVWGLVQRSTGSLDLLPGIGRPNVEFPFATFIYKNAGAAVLLPGLASALCLIWMSWLPSQPRRSSKRSGSATPGTVVSASRPTRSTDSPHGTSLQRRYGQGWQWSVNRSLALLLICVTISAGLLASLSRGAWLAALVATMVSLVVARTHLSGRVSVRAVSVPIALGVALVISTSLIDSVAERFRRLSLHEVYADARWQQLGEGFRAALHHLPVGSGLGTYGYATLAQQQHNSDLWFREAHNQYLETLTELGIPGALILVCVIVLVAKYSVRLLRDRSSRERSAIGLLGVSTLVAIAVQSCIDFVILNPALMFVTASIVGIVAQSCVQSSQPAKPTRALQIGRRPVFQRLVASPLIGVILVIGGLTFVEPMARNRSVVDSVLDATVITTADREPSPQQINEAIARLTDAARRQPHRWDVFQTRANWQVASFRAALKRASEDQGDPWTWAATSPDQLFQILMASQESRRRDVIAMFQEDVNLQRPLSAALDDLRIATQRNPFVPQVHLLNAFLAPAAAADHRLHAANLCRLARNSAELQFAAGLIGCYSGDEPMMRRQWRNSLRAHRPQLGQIIRLCRRTMTMDEIVKEIIPPDRSGYLLTMIRSLEVWDRYQLSADSELADEFERRVMADMSRTVAERHALLGWIYRELQLADRDVEHWRAALHADRGNANYRYQYCKALLLVGQHEEVLKQASLGIALNQHRDGFRDLARQARQRLERRTGRRVTDPIR